MAFPWPGKKDVREPGARPEFPSGLDLGDDDVPTASASKAENPLRAAAREPAARPSTALAAAHEGDELLALTQRLEGLGQLLDDAKEQVTSYLLHRESQSGSDDVSKTLARKFEALAERLEGSGGGRGLDQKLDALYGKIDQLTSASRTSGPASSGGSEGGGGGGV